MSEPRTDPIFQPCPVCGEYAVTRMADGWQQAVEEGTPIPIISCGNPWHYIGIEREAAAAPLLDVERLARALTRTLPGGPWMTRKYAQAVAAEYARLSRKEPRDD